MKPLYITISLIASTSWLLCQNIGIGTLTPDASAELDVVATDKGLLVPWVDTIDVMSLGQWVAHLSVINRMNMR